MAGRGRRVRQNEGGSAREPPLSRARVESVPGPLWTLNSDVADALLRGARPPEEVLLSECLERVGCDERVANGNVRMDVVIQEPEFYIPDDDLREMILSLPECQTYALVYRAVPLLRGHRITSVLQWGGADENADAKRAVRNELADDGLWNTVCGLLDDAFNAAKDAEAREKVVMSESEAAVVITGAFESVLKARWSYVESGHVDMPLGLKIFDGAVDGVVVPPVWSFAEVNEISGVDELEVLDLESDGERDMAAEHERDRVAAGQHCVEVFVLTSAMGWPYTRFIPANARCVFVRREMVRVWHVVEEQIQMWPNCTHQCPNKPYILLGTPGIGKSFGCGSYLLYELLHYDAAKVPAVAYFVSGSAYIFHKTGAMAGRVVFYMKAGDALSAMDKITAGNIKIEQAESGEGEVKRREMDGYIIFDVSGTFVPYSQFLLCRWGCIALSSPSTKKFAEWAKQNNALPIYINCYSRREIMAFHAFQERCVLRTDEEYIGAREQIESRWTEIRTRIREVGPLPRYIFDKELFDNRLKEVKNALKGITKSDMERYVEIFFGGEDWIEDRTTHKIIRLVWSSIDGHKSCRNYPASVVIAKELISRVARHFAGASCLLKMLRMPGVDGAAVLEKIGVCAFMYRSVVDELVGKMKHLPRTGGAARRSVLARVNAADRYAQDHRIVGFGSGTRQQGAKLDRNSLRPRVLYIPDIPNFPVVDGFYFVEAPPEDGGVAGGGGAGGVRWRNWTFVGVQVTKAGKHDTDCGAVASFMRRMEQCIVDWEQLKGQISWEIIYVQGRDSIAITRRQACKMIATDDGQSDKRVLTDEGRRRREERAQLLREHQSALAFWETVEQYRVKLDSELATMISRAAEIGERVLVERAGIAVKVRRKAGGKQKCS
ncbi:putative retrotransposon hot spot protein 4 (RHS4) [Trypanosoma vivax]|nr:putative retrotransposon hot spot protein 4 (RHS4) [Trypanosoma vivax]